MATKKKYTKKTTGKKKGTKKPLGNVPAKKKFPIGLAIGAVLVLGVAGAGYALATRKKGTAEFEEVDLVTTPPSSVAFDRTWKQGVFPLTEGMVRNSDVARVQMSLVAQGHLPEKTASGAKNVDGSLGPFTKDAIIKAGYNFPVSQQTYMQIVSDGDSAAQQKGAVAIRKTDKDIAIDIYNGKLRGNINEVVSALSLITDTSKYSMVNMEYKNYTDDRTGISKTIVNDLLTSFSKTSDRAALYTKFKAIGLKETNGIWSLSGLGNVDLITIGNTVVRTDRGEKMIIPRNTVIGKKVSSSNGLVRILTSDNRVFFAPESSVKVL